MTTAIKTFHCIINKQLYIVLIMWHFNQLYYLNKANIIFEQTVGIMQKNTHHYMVSVYFIKFG